jgi:imidazolonepropionase-like amidohydrolase
MSLRLASKISEALEHSMRKIPAALLLLSMLSLPVFAQQKSPGNSQPLALVHLNVIDATGAPVKADMTVVIVAGRIKAIAKSNKLRLPKQAQVIDATGKYLIPGLWDMHAHLGNQEFHKYAYLRLFLANGVTGIRVMWGESEHYLWRKEIASGKWPGPRMVVASREIDEANTNSAQAREAIRKAIQEGADFFKVHDRLPKESYFALIEEAKRLAMRVEGHVPAAVSAEEASLAGQKSVEHFTGLDAAKADERKALALSAVFKKQQTWLCPTLIMRHSYAVLDNQQLVNDARLKYVEPSWQKRWLRMVNESGNAPASQWSERKALVQREKQLVGRMHKAGVGILAGTDDANPFCFPGFSIHDELAMLVDAGLTPLEALQTATLNPAKFLNKFHMLGTVEKGKLADLLLLDVNPLVDIGNTRRIHAVIVNGRFVGRQELDQMLYEVELAVRKKE